MKYICYLICITSLIYTSCNTFNSERTFFPLMKEHYELSDTLSVLNKFYSSEFNRFGLSKKHNIINNKAYFKINNYSKDNIFNLKGLLRSENGIVYLYPLTVNNEQNVHEQIFLKFNAKNGESWDLCYDSDSLFCNRISFYYAKYNMELKDTLYLFNILPSAIQKQELHEDPNIYILVSKKYGITKILLIPLINTITIIDLLKSQIISSKNVDDINFL